MVDADNSFEGLFDDLDAPTESARPATSCSARGCTEANRFIDEVEVADSEGLRTAPAKPECVYCDGTGQNVDGEMYGCPDCGGTSEADSSVGWTVEQKRDYRIQVGDAVRHRKELFFGCVLNVQFRAGFEVMLTVRREEVVFKTNSPELYDVLTLGRESRVRDIHL